MIRNERHEVIEDWVARHRVNNLSQDGTGILIQMLCEDRTNLYKLCKKQHTAIKLAVIALTVGIVLTAMILSKHS